MQETLTPLLAGSHLHNSTPVSSDIIKIIKPNMNIINITLSECHDTIQILTLFLLK